MSEMRPNVVGRVFSAYTPDIFTTKGKDGKPRYTKLGQYSLRFIDNGFDRIGLGQGSEERNATARYYGGGPVASFGTW